MNHTVIRYLQFPYTFLLMNWAVVVGLYYYVRGHQGFWDAETAAGKRTPRVTAVARLRQL